MLVGCAVLPHGDFAFDPDLIRDRIDEKSYDIANELHMAAVHVGKLIGDLKPDVILLVTPHGIAHQKDVLIFRGTKSSGYADIGQDISDIKYRIQMERTIASDFSNSMANFLYPLSSNISELSAFGGNYPTPINWGEVIPLSFIKYSAPVAILSIPTRRLTDGAKLIPEFLSVGSWLRDFIDSSPNKVFVVISGDLAHTHDPNGPYGFSTSAEIFDEAIFRWCRTLDADSLLLQGGEHLSRALCCGYLGFVLLHGMLSKDSSAWSATLVAGGHPTYYGMAVATFMASSPHVSDNIASEKGL